MPSSDFRSRPGSSLYSFETVACLCDSRVPSFTKKKTNRYLLLDGYLSVSLPSSFSLLLGIVHGLFTLFNKHEFKDHPGVKVIKKIGTLIGETACDLTLEGMVSHCMSEAT